MSEPGPEPPVYGTPPSAEQPEQRPAPPPSGRLPRPARARPARARPARARPAGPLSRSDERLWTTLGHLGGILVPVIPALVVYLAFRERSGVVAAGAREALNFQITLLIAYVVVGIVLSPLTPLLWVANVVFCVIAAVASGRGAPYRYPFALRLVS